MPASARRAVPLAVPLAVAAVTAVAFTLRLPGVGQSLAGDEYFTHTIVTRSGLGGVWDDVYHTSITPPLHYVLAWLSVQFGGDTTVLVRLPSLIFGTALVPLVFLLGRRAGGVIAGLLAAAVIALGPFSIWYADEARAYATMMFLVALSTYALLRALETRRRAWWVVYAVAACAALWAHYTAVFVVAAEAAWALWTHRDRWRPLTLAQLAIVLGFAPWIPGFLEQRRNDLGIEVIGALAPQTPLDVLVLPLRLLAGHPGYGLDAFPGVKGWVLVAVVVLVAAAALRRGPSGWHSVAAWLRSERGLLAALALATPVGLVLYALAGSSLFIPRNLSASLPALAALAAVLLTDLVRGARLARPAAAVAFGMVLAVLVLDAADTLSADHRRAPYREAAAYIDRVSPREDPVVELTSLIVQQGDARLPSTLTSMYFEPGRSVYPANDAAGAWSVLGRGQDVFVLAPANLIELVLRGQLNSDVPVPPDIARRLAQLGGPDGRAVMRSSRTLRGAEPVVVRRYRGTVQGRLHQGTISWSLADRLPVVAGAVRGEAVSSATGVTGWATGPGQRPAEWVLGFKKKRLVAVAPAWRPRPDVARREGASAVLSGFQLTGSPDRVFAVAGGRASELPLSAG